jgi:hypothetical protein
MPENIEKTVEDIENFYKKRISYLVSEDRFGEAESLFLEFVVKGKNPTTFYFIPKR